MMVKGSGAGAEVGRVLERGVRALGQPTRWIWEPELPGVGWKSLGRKNRPGLPFSVLTWLLGSGVGKL